MKRKILGEVAIKVDFGCPCFCHGVVFVFFDFVPWESGHNPVIFSTVFSFLVQS
jgi:hypothetical protein